MGLVACDSPEDVPSYLYIKNFTMSTNPATEGFSGERFTEAWVYVNDNVIGAYTLPTEVPIPATGDVRLTIYPGVRNNSSSTTPAIYFNCNRYDATLNMKAGKTDTITPKTSYAPDVTIAWLEGFDAGNSLTVPIDGTPNSTFQVTPKEVKYGVACGYFEVNEAKPYVSVTTATAFKQIPNSDRAYLEVDYKGTADLEVKLIANKSSGASPLEIARLVAKNEWRKAYVKFDFKNYNATEFPSFNFIFAAALPKDINGNVLKKEAELRIDNIKLIYPKQ
jgi:hypothetical protein